MFTKFSRQTFTFFKTEIVRKHQRLHKVSSLILKIPHFVGSLRNILDKLVLKRIGKKVLKITLRNSNFCSDIQSPKIISENIQKIEDFLNKLDISSNRLEAENPKAYQWKSEEN